MTTKRQARRWTSATGSRELYREAMPTGPGIENRQKESQEERNDVKCIPATTKRAKRRTAAEPKKLRKF